MACRRSSIRYICCYINGLSNPLSSPHRIHAENLHICKGYYLFGICDKATKHTPDVWFFMKYLVIMTKRPSLSYYWMCDTLVSQTCHTGRRRAWANGEPERDCLWPQSPNIQKECRSFWVILNPMEWDAWPWMRMTTWRNTIGSERYLGLFNPNNQDMGHRPPVTRHMG